MGYGKKNKVVINPLAYNIGLIGESGIGKTTIIKEMCEKLVGEDGYLFLECGKEDGADAIEGINYINCPQWSQDYDELSNSIGFEDLIEDILENKTSEYKDLKVVVIDTYDQLFEIAKSEVIRMHNRDNPDKRVKSIKQAFGGYMGGEDKASEIILDKLWALKKVGIHFIIIGHVKAKEQEDVTTGNKYSSLTTNMAIRDFNKIKTKLHFLGVASIDREMMQEKTGKKDNKGKDIIKNIITKESRKITFRDDSYSIDSKSRFADITPSIPFEVDELIKALNDAIKNEQSKSGRAFDEVKAEQEKLEVEKLKVIAEQEKANKENKQIAEVKEAIINFIKENKDNKSSLQPLLAKTKELGYDNPTQVDNKEDAITLLKICKAK